jgi:hypothetical protein
VNIKPVASPHQIMPTGTSSSTARETRARVIDMISKPAAQPQAPQQPLQHAVNQNNISPEEMSAIIPKSRQLDEIVESEAASPADTEVASQPPKVEPDPALSRQFAQLARQEKALRAKVHAQEQAFKAKEAAFAAREAELTSKQPDLSKYISRDQLQSEVLNMIDRGDVSYDEVAQRMLNRQPSNPQVDAQISRLQAKIDQLEQQSEQSKKAVAEQQTQSYQAAVKQIRNDVNKLVFTDPAFETIKATRSIDDVVELITRTYEKDGQLLSVEEAAEQVEEYLVAETLKLTNVEKIKKRLGLNATAQSSKTQPPKSQEQQTQPTMKTLTNSTSSSRKLSAKERAILAFKNELKTS